MSMTPCAECGTLKIIPTCCHSPQFRESFSMWNRMTDVPSARSAEAEKPTRKYSNGWAETGLIGTETPQKTYISALSVRMSLEPGGRVMVFIQYDSSGEWEHTASITSSDLRCFSLPVHPRRCDHLRLKFQGKGSAKIFSVTRTLTRGSEL